MLIFKPKLVFGLKVSIMRDSFITFMGYQIEYVFFEISACAANPVDLLSSYHFSKGYPYLPGTQCACHTKEHLVPSFKMLHPFFSCIYNNSGVKMLKILLYEIFDTHNKSV